MEKKINTFATLLLQLRYYWFYARATNGKGHGIHSPFVFSFITNLLNKKQADIVLASIKKKDVWIGLQKKHCTLLYYLISFFNIHTVGMGGHSNAQLVRFLQTIHQHKQGLHFYGNLLSTAQELKKVDLIHLDCLLPTTEKNILFSQLHKNTIVVFISPHATKATRKNWKHTQAHTTVTLTIDLFWIGFVFFRTENKVKQNFAIRY